MSSTAGICAICGKWANKLFGGEGRYLPHCLDCWIKGEANDMSPTASEES